MKRLFFCLFLMVFGRVFAQPGIEWQKCLGGNSHETGHSIQTTNDEGFIVAGFALSNNNGDVQGVHGGGDAWVVKLGPSGELQWQNALGGSSSEVAYSVQQTSDGGYVMGGKTYSNNGDVLGNHGDVDYWVVKLDSNGAIEWQKALGGSSSDEGNALQQTRDGGYIMAGNSASIDGDVTGNQGYFDIWVVKLDPNGQITWQKSIGGGNGSDKAYYIRQTLDRGYILAGESNSTNGDISGNHGDNDFCIVKLNELGEIEWQKSLGGNGIDAAYSIQQTLDGGYITVGTTGSGNTGQVSGDHGGFDIWVVKLNEVGDLQWQKALGGSNQDYGRDILQLNNGNYLVSGTVYSANGDVQGNDGGVDIWMVILDEFGEILSQKTFGGTQPEFCNSITQTSDGSIAFIGKTESMDGDVSGNHGQSDFWVVKLAPPSSPTTQTSPQALTLYPNPTTQSITIQIPDTESPLNIQITDLLGRELGRQTIPNGGTVDIESLPNGVYLVAASTESGEVFLGRVCKQE